MPREDAPTDEEEMPGAASPEAGEEQVEMGSDERGTPIPADTEEGDDERVDPGQEARHAREEHGDDRDADHQLGHEPGEARVERVGRQGFG